MFGKIDRSLWKIIIIGIAFAVVAFLSSCRSHERVVTVTHTVHDTLYMSTLQRDSIYLRDSVLIQQKGDTVYLDRWRYAYKESTRTDTIIQTVCDSIPVTVTVEKPVPYIPKWGKAFIGMGIGISALAFIGFFLWIGWLALRSKVPQ